MRAPDGPGLDERTSVLVVGAGPTGLLLAAELRRRDVPCELIDAQPAPLPWDRATVMHPRSLELFESLGLAERLLDVGTPQRGARVHSAGEVLGAFDLAACGSRYGFSLGISEEVTESVLTDYPFGAKKVIPFETHGRMDASFAASSFWTPKLFGFSDSAEAQIFKMNGFLEGMVVGMTDWNSERARGESLSREVAAD